MFMRELSALIFAGTMFFAENASATIISMTYTGLATTTFTQPLIGTTVVSQGTFSLNFLFDTSLALGSNYSNNGISWDLYSPDNAPSFGLPIVGSAFLSLSNGVEESYGDYNAEAHGQIGSTSQGALNSFLSGKDGRFFESVSMQVSSPQIPGALIPYTTTSGLTGVGAFSLYPGFDFERGITSTTTGILIPTSLMVSIDGAFASPVPESSTWAMLLIGFGLVTGASRRLRKPHRIIVV